MLPLNIRSDRARYNPDGSRWARLALNVLTGITVIAVVLICWASLVAAGKIDSDAGCVIAPTLSWAPDFPEFSGSVTLDTPTGPVTGLPVAGTRTGEWASKYTAHFINGADGIEWGTATVWTPAGQLCEVETVEVGTAIVVTPEAPPTTPAAAVLGIAIAAPAPTVATAAAPVATTAAPVSSGTAQLPATGRTTDLLLLAGTLTAAAGVALLIIRRKDPVIAD